MRTQKKTRYSAGIVCKHKKNVTSPSNMCFGTHQSINLKIETLIMGFNGPSTCVVFLSDYYAYVLAWYKKRTIIQFSITSDLTIELVRIYIRRQFFLELSIIDFNNV